MSLHAALAAMLVALAIDAAIGWPDALFRRIGHPITWCGALIGLLDRAWNKGPAPLRRLGGTAAALLVIFISAVIAGLLQLLMPFGVPGILLTGVLAWPLVAARSLDNHVAAVAAPLAQNDLPRARREVAKIVGRDPERLDAPGIARAALESLAENSSDGIIAPLFWGALFGLPGIAAYKAVNTLDSMLGHRSPRYLAFGWASARIDDLANLIPARLTALLFVLAARERKPAFVAMWRDARHHRSPNGGWPEAALAGALGIRLSGPRAYGDGIAQEPWINAPGRDPGAAEIYAGLALYRLMLVLAGFALALAAL
ncbi:MAG TPA: adenosylcobinamide-phosphate synthase CbiB [Acidocella sp.]|jgi:adenosylcobinamide-phosphate synthase|nr:adenosylcobinamide-phosphate synthase CbiB [Acidocella sp.]